MNLGENLIKKRRDQQQANKKRDFLLQAQGFIERYELPVDSKKMDSEGFYNYFLNIYSETYKQYPSFMTPEEKLKASNIDTLPLRTLEASYKAVKVPFNPVTMNIPETENYDIILTGIEEELYLVRAETIQQLEKLQAIAEKKLSRIFQTPTIYTTIRPLLHELKKENSLEKISMLNM